MVLLLVLVTTMPGSTRSECGSGTNSVCKSMYADPGVLYIYQKSMTKFFRRGLHPGPHHGHCAPDTGDAPREGRRRALLTKWVIRGDRSRRVDGRARSRSGVVLQRCGATPFSSIVMSDGKIEANEKLAEITKEMLAAVQAMQATLLSNSP